MIAQLDSADSEIPDCEDETASLEAEAVAALPLVVRAVVLAKAGR